VAAVVVVVEEVAPSRDSFVMMVQVLMVEVVVVAEQAVLVAPEATVAVPHSVFSWRIMVQAVRFRIVLSILVLRGMVALEELVAKVEQAESEAKVVETIVMLETVEMVEVVAQEVTVVRAAQVLTVCLKGSLRREEHLLTQQTMQACRATLLKSVLKITVVPIQTYYSHQPLAELGISEVVLILKRLMARVPLP
jgi:hypothetical protein